jgi:anti-anti-sigma factor
MSSLVLSLQSQPKALVAAVQCTELDHDNAVVFQRELDEAITDSHQPVIIDLSNVHFLPSMALGILVAANKRLQQAGRRCFLVGVQPEVREIITVTGLQKLLDLRASIDEAVQQL